jgi:ankyrin repeat protein
VNANVHAANRNGDTALHVAAALGYDSVVQLLAERGADVTSVNARGVTPVAAATFGSTTG